MPILLIKRLPTLIVFTLPIVVVKRCSVLLILSTFVCGVVDGLTDVLMPAAVVAIMLIAGDGGDVLARSMPSMVVLLAVSLLMMATLCEAIVVCRSLHAVVDADATVIGCHQSIGNRRVVRRGP